MADPDCIYISGGPGFDEQDENSLQPLQGGEELTKEEMKQSEAREDYNRQE